MLAVLDCGSGGMEITMQQILTLLIKFVLKILRFIFLKVGINGILIVVLLIELPILHIYYQEESQQYRWEQEYRISQSPQIRPLSKEEALELGDLDVYEGESHYLTELSLDNLYSNDIRYLSIYAKNQDGYELRFHSLDYYDSAQGKGQTVIPAGTRGKKTYVLSLSESEMEELDTLIFFERKGEEQKTLVQVDFKRFRAP